MAAGSGLRLLPQAFEPMPGNAGVMGGVLGIAVAEVILHRAQIGRKVIAAAVTQHVRPHPAELRLFAGKADDIIDGLAGKLCLPLGHEQPGADCPPGWRGSA